MTLMTDALKGALSALDGVRTGRIEPSGQTVAIITDATRFALERVQTEEDVHRNALLGIAMMDAHTREGEEPPHELMRRIAKTALGL